MEIGRRAVGLQARGLTGRPRPRGARPRPLRVRLGRFRHRSPLDNAAEFRGKALRSGASQYNIELQYLPVRRPNFGGHAEQVMRTLMERLRALRGATGGSTKGRKGRNPEATAAMTLPELERWLAIEIGRRYHNSKHRGLAGGTPAGAWKAGVGLSPPRLLPPEADAVLQFIVRFLPVERRPFSATA